MSSLALCFVMLVIVGIPGGVAIGLYNRRGSFKSVAIASLLVGAAYAGIGTMFVPNWTPTFVTEMLVVLIMCVIIGDAIGDAIRKRLEKPQE